MKATELMIGDWVIPRIWDADSTPSKIVGIHYNSYREKDYVDWVDCEVRDELDMNDIKPIPITVEILEKNGFEQTGDSTFSISDDGMRFNVTWWSKTMFNVGFYRRGNNSPSEQCCLNVCYVHELQHALRLCGMNELADNFKI